MKLTSRLKLAALLVATLSIGQAFAGSGKAIVPHWTANSGDRSSHIFISNISATSVNVSVSFYGKNGAKLSPSTYNNFTVANTQLAAKSTGYVSIDNSGSDWGFAVIEWSNLEGEDSSVALVAHGFREVAKSTSVSGNFAIPINNGMPF